ncbi:MAG: lipid II flippase MurJ, partial [Terrabacter sp.]
QVGFFISQGALNNATAHAKQLGLAAAARGPAAYGVAFTLFMLPHAFITVSVITSLFPRFSAAAAAGDRAGLRRYFRTGLTVPLVANVPIMVAVIVLANPIVALLNPGVAVNDPRGIDVSASVLIIMILGLIPFGLDLLCYRMFFALEDGKPTVVMQVLLTGISAVAGVITLFIDPIWAIGVMAMGQTVGNVVSSGVGIYLLRRRTGSLGLTSALLTASRVGIAAAVAGVAAWGATEVLEPISSSVVDSSSSTAKHMFASTLEIGLVGLVFLVIYLGLAHAMHVKEIRQAADMVRARLGR